MLCGPRLGAGKRAGIALEGAEGMRVRFPSWIWASPPGFGRWMLRIMVDNCYICSAVVWGEGRGEGKGEGKGMFSFTLKES